LGSILIGDSGKDKAPTRRRHVPLRTCIACHQKKPKRGLIRIVRTAEGMVEVDLTGKRPGRGAYLCRDRDCWDVALGSGAMGRALKSRVSAQDLQALVGYATALPSGGESDCNEVP
jgi:predicted RNA-binding protein YlxR (DUF448 family)